MANLFYLPFRPVYDNAGVSVPGAKAYFTLTGTNTITPVYSNSGLSTPRTNPVVANGVGKFPTIYLDPAVNYRVRIYDADATVGVSTPLEEFDPYVPGLFADADALEPVADAAAASATAAAASAGQAEAAYASIAASDATIAHAANRTALALLGSSVGPVYMRESGREGVFVFDSTDISANVSGGYAYADTAQGVYVLPASDLTGASGAWVRRTDGPHNIKWFGAKGDGATDDSAAFAAALAHFGATAQGGFAYSSSAPELFFPKSHYYLGTTTLELTYTVILTGENTGQAGGGSSVLRWAANTTGIRTQRANTTGATATQASSGHGGDGSLIRNLYLKGGFSTTEGEYHGIQLRATATIRDCFIENFQGDAIYIKATIGGGVGSEGAANLFRIDNVFTQTCRNGLYVEGADANAGLVTSFSAIACRQWGIWDKSFLGNTYLAPHVASCGRNSWNTGGAAAPASFASQGGNRYVVIRGQEAGAATNAPTGSATNNTWWVYIGSGAADATTGVPAWTSGFTYRAGGAYLVEGLSNAVSLFNPYAEIDQYSQFDQNTSILGNGFLQGHIKVSAGVATSNRLASMGGSLNGFRFNGTIEVAGDANLKSASNFIGPQSGTTDATTTYYTTNAYAAFQGQMYGGAVLGSITFRNSLGTDYDTVGGATWHRFKINAADTAYVVSSGFDTASGKTYKVNGTQVVTARQTGTAAVATDLATAITLVNDLRAKLITHGLIS
jgi:hypothetical protein